MTPKYQSLFIALFLIAFIPLTAYAADPKPRQNGHFIDIKEVKSKSGITAWLVEDHSLPIIAMDFAFRNAGAKQDPVNKQGLARLASNTMDEGAGEYDSEAFQQALTDNSISLSFGSGRDNFTGSVKTLSRKKDLAFKLLTLALTEPRFDAEPLERMRDSNITRIQRSRGKPNWMAARLMNDIAYEGHPYAQNSGGTLTTLKNITADDLHNFTRTHLSRDNLVVSVVGDITADELSKILDDIFGTLPANENLPVQEDLDIQNTGAIMLLEQDMPQTIISMAQNGIARDDPDYYTAAVMNYILGSSGFGSRLMEEIREKRGLTYGIYSGLDTSDHINQLTVGTSTKNETVNDVLDLIKQEWTKMKTTEVTAQELADAKSYLIGSMPLALSSTNKISGLLLGLQLDNLPIDYLDHRAEKINAVSKEDIARVASKLLTPDKMVTILVGKPENVKPTKIVDTLPNVD